MAAPFALTDTVSTPDILNTGRMVLMFGSVPGVADDGINSVGGQGLSLKAADVTIPGFTIAQIRVPILGFTRGFRGHFDHQNHFSAIIYEDSNGGTINTLWNWMNFIRNFDDGTGPDSSVYGSHVTLCAYTSTGDEAYSFTFDNVWPMNVSPAASSDDGMTPARHNVEFSMDNPRWMPGTYNQSQVINDLRTPGNSINPSASNTPKIVSSTTFTGTISGLTKEQAQDPLIVAATRP